MSGIAAHTLADRFAWFFDGLCKAIGVNAHKRGVEAALAWAIWNRVLLLGQRLIALGERARAGRLRVRTQSSPPQERERARAVAVELEQQRPASKLPREFGWLRRMLPETGQFAGVLSYLLRDPEVAALVERAPEAGRILRPLCHSLGIRTPDFLRRRAGGIADAVASPAPATEDGEDTLADAVAAETTDAPAAEAPPVVEAVPFAVVPPPVPHHLRPGGLYWDGRRWQWS